MIHQLKSKTRRSFKIILLGDSGVGKTSIIERYIHQTFDPNQQPTIGIDFLGKQVNVKGINYRVQLWDSAGQEKYMSLIPAYLRDADCVLFVFDMHNELTLQNIEKWVTIFRQNNQRKALSFLCGNKSDLEKNFDKLKLKEVMQKYKMSYHTVSALSSQNISQLFQFILNSLAKNLNEENQTLKKLEEMQGEMQSAPTEGGMVDSNKVKVRDKKPRAKIDKQNSCIC